MKLYFTDKDGNELTTKQAFHKIIVRFHTIWLEFVTGFLWWFVGYIPSHSIRNFFYRLSGMKIGKNSTIHMMSRIYDPRHIEIGEGTLIGEKSSLDGRKQLHNSKGGLKIGNHVDIASEVMIWTSQHDLTDPYMKTLEKKVVIEDYTFIGPRAIILPGVTIGKGAVVAGGAVVSKDVAPLDIVAGIPAQKIGERKIDKLEYRLGRPRLFQ